MTIDEGPHINESDCVKNCCHNVKKMRPWISPCNVDANRSLPISVSTPTHFVGSNAISALYLYEMSDTNCVFNSISLRIVFSCFVLFKIVLSQVSLFVGSDFVLFFIFRISCSVLSCSQLKTVLISSLASCCSGVLVFLLSSSLQEH